MENRPILVIMAAGMGSRFGGLKQIAPVNEQGEIILDFSLYDAMMAGFKKAIIVIKKENEDTFREILKKPMVHMEIEFAYQELSDLPDETAVPKGREKPWGTGHAMLSARNLIDQPFAIINADDYYGPTAFQLIYSFLENVNDDSKAHFTMISFNIENTLTENGSVSRGVCQISDKNMLTSITERTKIYWNHDKISFEDSEVVYDLDKGTPVSMNFWGFTPMVLKKGEELFRDFVKNELKENPLKKEFYLPSLVDTLIKNDLADVKVLKSPDRWYGITYKEDRDEVVNALASMKDRGLYPEILWK